MQNDSRMKVAVSATLFSCMLALGGCAFDSKAKRVMLPSTAPPTASESEILVSLKPTEKTRYGRLQVHLNANGNPSFEDPGEEELMRGDVKVGNEQMTFYVPKYGPHPLTSKDNHSFENTSTLLSVDSNHNGKIDHAEDWWTSRPIRLGEQMFDVKAIDPGTSWILLSKSQAKLAGAVKGKRCPSFQFFATNGKMVSLADYKGKVLLLDVWSMT
ncbi:MAG TPA: hypothetical protein V6C97_36605 [Oculatellaceae cyanobacterium]